MFSVFPVVNKSVLYVYEAARPRKFGRLRSSARVLLWIGPLAFLLVFFFYPLARILLIGASASIPSLHNLAVAAQRLGFTLYQAALSTVLTFALGFPSAILFARYEFRGRRFLRALTAVPFMLPTVVVAAAFNSLLGPRGWLNLGRANPIPFVGTLGAILIAHVFYNTTIVVRLVGSALAAIDPSLEAAARSLGANTLRVWSKVILPLVRPAILAAALLVFLFDFTSFGVILLLGGSRFSTLEVEIYLRVLKIPNLPLAALLAIIQLIFTLLFSILYSQLVARSAVQNAPRSSRPRAAKGFVERTFVIAASFALVLFFLLPLASLPARSFWRVEADRGERGGIQLGPTFDYYRELFINRRDSLFYVPPIDAAINSLTYATVTMILSLLLGFPAALALARPGTLERVLDPLLILPLGASAVMLGLGFIVAFGAALRSPLFVPIAHTLVALPFVIRALQPAIASIPERLHQAAAVLGASPANVRLRVDLPLISRALLSAAAFAFTISLGEFGATLLLSRPDYPTIPVAISRFLALPGGLNYGQAMAMSTILMALTLVSILLIEREDVRLA